MKDRVVNILKDVFEDENINASCSQSNYEKWDSMAQLNIVVEVESEFGVDLTPEEILSMKCVDDIVAILIEKQI